MQQILNSQERTQAFFKFLTFFLITVILVVVAVYFNTRVPEKENDWLQSQLDIQRIKDANQDKFIARMQDAVTLLGELNKKDANVNLIKGSLNQAITDMQALQQNENTQYGKLDKTLVATFDELSRTKNDVEKLRGYGDDVGRLTAELKECKSNLINALSRQPVSQ